MTELGFWGIPPDFTAWKLLNSQFLATFVGALVAFLVAKYGKRAADAAAESAAEQGASNATQQARQLEEDAMDLAEKEFDVAGGAESLDGAVDYRDQARALVARAKNYLDNKAAEDPDGRHRRTYEAISRYDYIPLALALSVRGRLKDEQMAAAVSLFSRWKFYERGKASRKSVPQDIFGRMEESYQALTRAG